MKIIKEIFDQNKGCKWQILQDEETNKYYLSYYEYYTQGGWQLISKDTQTSYTKEFLQEIFSILIED